MICDLYNIQDCLILKDSRIKAKDCNKAVNPSANEY